MNWDEGANSLTTSRMPNRRPLPNRTGDVPKATVPQHWLRAPAGFDNRLDWQKSRRRPDSQGGISVRRDIEFKTEDGLTLRGWHYVPDGSSGRVPTIVMAHGFSAVKEMFLDRF